MLIYFSEVGNGCLMVDLVINILRDRVGLQLYIPASDD